MQLPNLLPKWLRGKDAEPEGSVPVSNLAAEPEGSAPKNLVFKIGVVLMAVLMAMVILLVPDEQAANPQAIVAQPLPPPAGPEAVTDGEQGIQEAEDQRRLDQARQAREQQQAQQQAQREAQRRALELQQDFQRQQAQANAGVAGAAMGQQELTPEQQLQQSIRLEKIQRRHSSLRAAPVALSFRSPVAASPPVPQLEQTPPPVAPQPVPVPPPAAAPAAQEPEPATPAEQALVEDGVVAAVRQPQSARGWERIDGGQWLEAVLVTQIRGDAPGPAIALVSTPFWSRDRQRILIPKGARFIGRAQAVGDRDQARLTVTFDRLIFDGHDLRLPFAGLSQAGEAGLKDQVNRHYLQTFGAAGAVGVLSGLMLRGTQNYGFGQPAGEAARMETGRALAGASMQILSRYLNRLPSITIRAGHRIRIYFTSDLLVPRKPA
ncbi:MAG: TrbI/VirB10 family protein [Bryobacterales bacterium]|nr:TrbI/VirB10 family protein [Bryobacterales bacterium]MDE0434194.1 TrbI/VirB10 family protein [Bryobacterales bacterium]